MIRLRGSLHKCVGMPFWRANKWLWNHLPVSWRATRLIYWYGAFLHFIIRRRSTRNQFHGTYFLRNRPELKLICELINKRPTGSSVRLGVLGCSNGAEVYSILWAVRSARPDLRVLTFAIDVSAEILEVARQGIYSLNKQKLMDSPIFERLGPSEMRDMFEICGTEAIIKSWIKEDIKWQVGDAEDPQLVTQFGPQDIVVANRFLCHMMPREAERCLRNLARLLTPGGYLFVSGVDLDIRTRVARDLGWLPIRELLDQIHDGDVSVRRDWPWEYWGLEPLNRKRSDWCFRYASAFQVGQLQAS